MLHRFHRMGFRMKDDLMAIGKITKLHGLRGELRMMPFFDVQELLAHFDRLWLVKAGQVKDLSVEKVRQQGRFIILKFHELDEPVVAERFRGWEVAVSRESLPSLPAGQYYGFQLVGLTVVTEDGRVLGEVRQILPTAAHDLYCVGDGQDEMLIPAVKEIVKEIDLIEGRMIIHPPEGLLE